MKKTRKIILSALIVLTFVLSGVCVGFATAGPTTVQASTTAPAATTTAAPTGYVPLRPTLEGMGCTVEWYKDLPDQIFVRIGDQLQVFKNHSTTIVTDEGEFHASKETYIEAGTTYIAQDAAQLVKNLNLYHISIKDAEIADTSELLPLYALDASDDKILLCTWHKYPSSYPDGEEVTLKYGDVWTTAAGEIVNLDSRENLGTGDAFVLRMEQIMGVPPQNGKTHFTLMWAKPEDVYRPAYDTRIDTKSAVLTFPAGTDDTYKQWFADQQEYSYSPHRYPWTGLGYTFDWADNGTDYGLSEYIIKGGATVKVEKTFTNEEFLDYICGH